MGMKQVGDVSIEQNDSVSMQLSNGLGLENYDTGKKHICW